MTENWIEETVNWQKDDADGKPVNYRISPLVGFNVMQTSAFRTAYTRVLAASAAVTPLSRGSDNPARVEGNGRTVRQNLIERITAEGISDLCAEIQRQLDLFLAAQ